jgi:hypothetical protein
LPKEVFPVSERKQSTNKTKPEHTIRCGQVTASIHYRQSNTGFNYYDFTLSRCWKSMRNSKEVFGASLFEQNEDDAIKCIRQACEWIRGRTNDDSDGTNNNSDETAP